MPTFHLTKRTIEAIPLTELGQILYRDSELTGFGIRVGSKSKVFFVEGQVNRRTVRVTIGKYGPLTPEIARRLALKSLSDMAQGRDPNADKRRNELRQVSLRAAFQRFFAAKPSLSPRTVESYTRTVNLYLLDWAERPVQEISRSMILAKHRELSDKRGALTANAVMRHLRSVYNFTAASQADFPPNPVTILAQARAWAPEKRRRRLIAPHALPDWWAAVMEEPRHSRDFLLLALFTGMRRREIAGLRWEHIDLKVRTLRVPTTKNGDPLELPLSGFLTRLLIARKLLLGPTTFVFPSCSASGHVEEVKTFTSRVTERCGISFSVHDLRRTFITVAESLDVPAYTLKRLLNHRGGKDVTEGYIIIDVERLRAPIEAISNQIEGITIGKTKEACAATYTI
jgi:integrase